AIAIGLAIWVGSCSAPPRLYAGPGCRIDIYTSPGLQGPGISILTDTPEMAEIWRNAASSAKVVYGTWRLFADSYYKGFMGDYTAPAVVLELRPTRELESLRCLVPEPPLPHVY